MEGIYPLEFPGGQWLGLCALTAKGMCSIPDWGTKIPEARSNSKKRGGGWNLFLLGSGSVVKNLPIKQQTSIPVLGRSPGEGNDSPLHCRMLAWELLTEGPDRLQSMGVARV